MSWLGSGRRMSSKAELLNVNATRNPRLSKKSFVGFHMDLSQLRRSRSAASRPNKARSAAKQGSLRSPRGRLVASLRETPASEEVYSSLPGKQKETIPHPRAPNQPRIRFICRYIFLNCTKAKRDAFATFINVFQSLLTEG